MKKYFKFILLLGIILIFLTGCVVDLVVPENDVNSPATEGSQTDENPEGISGTGKGTLKIYLTDAPGDYLEVNINISRIEGHIAVEDEEGYWEDLKKWDNGLAVDLLTLENVSLLLGSSELPANKYTQLRIFLKEEATLVLEGEEEGSTVTKTLEIPSSANSGIKLNRPFEIVEGMITELTIDFDAEKSVIKTGNGKYKMKPVISVSSETYSTGGLPEGVGSVSGSVSYYKSEESVLVLAGIGGANIELTEGAYIFENTTTTSEEPDLEGDFILNNVPAGSYTLNVYADGYDDYSESIEVIAGSDTVVDVVLLSGGISGIVKEFESESTFIAGATVTATLSGGDIFNSSTSTNESGEFAIEQLPVGSYDLIISADDYDDSSIFTVAVTEGVINNISVVELTPSTP